MYKKIRACLLAAFLIWGVQVQCVADSDGAGRYAKLARDIQQVLDQTRTPGAAVALLEPGKEPWVYTRGFAHLESRQPITVDSVFRTGSVAKILVSLSVMKLVEEGRVSLEDRVANLVPEVEFNNPWEDSNPLLLAHLLNHSSGWDAPHFPELVASSTSPIGIIDQLALHPHSRTSRWVPGTRSAYNNTGPLVAAYIVEKLTGKPFEEYVSEHFFTPLGMVNSGYFFDDHYRQNAVTQYRKGVSMPYWHLGNRAAGGLNSSLSDLVAFIRLLQQPDLSIEGIISSTSVRTMEAVQASQAGGLGLEVGWGLGLTSFHHKGFVWSGHEGSLPGAGVLIAYEPEGEIGHVVLVNQDGPAAARIHKLLQAFIVAEYGSQRAKQTDSRLANSIKNTKVTSGYYRNISPIADRARVIPTITPWKIQQNENDLTITPLLGGSEKSVRMNVGGKGVQPETGRVVLVQGEDPLVGSVIHYGPITLEPISTLHALASPALVISWVLVTLLGTLFAVGGWVWRIFSARTGDNSRFKVWPVATVMMGLVTVLCANAAFSSPEPYTRAASISLPGIFVFVGSIVFFAMAIWGLRELYIGFAKQRGFARWYTTVWLALNACIAVWLLIYGGVGLRLWI
ncbi:MULTISPECIES: beta-lactamase family protein [Microbulbifer]|uniref:beta-lactamase family protein n=1 Tax=Microbulbifer TaxID=48073 RepID=UPI001CD35415|nr:beta-lactamase family protein [Microbulbifer agarilyticus]MCA0900257.1 beta-lactamase family protein [Microbulbifer agarilyticus]